MTYTETVPPQVAELIRTGPTLQVFHDDQGWGEELHLDPAPRVLYSVATNEARFTVGPCTISGEDGHIIRFELADGPDPRAELAVHLELAADEQYLLRCDRVDLPPEGVADWHTHQGPGIRCLVSGGFSVRTVHELKRVPLFGAWFERGPDPVRAQAWAQGPAAFVRVMVLPRRLLGTSSIRYVEQLTDRTPPQRYTVFIDEPVEL